jgi:hypothetical protein
MQALAITELNTATDGCIGGVALLHIAVSSLRHTSLRGLPYRRHIATHWVAHTTATNYQDA